MAKTFGSLFAGIGGIDLGLERAGWKCKWQVENDGYCQRVLAKHWPLVRRHDDVRTFPPDESWDRPDLICGGFPCQPVARGGQAGRESDERWLWPEFARIISVFRPPLAFLENVPGLLDGGIDTVLGDLASMGFDAEWGVISACMFGAPHTRERLFLLAYPNGIHGEKRFRFFPHRTTKGEPGHPSASSRHWLEPFSGALGLGDGVPARMDRLRVVGNAVVPQIAEWIGRRT